MESVGLGGTDAVAEDGEEIDPWGGEDDDIEQTPSAQSVDLEREWEARRLQFHNGTTRQCRKDSMEASMKQLDQGLVGELLGELQGIVADKSGGRETLGRIGLDHIQHFIRADAMGMYYKDTVLQKGGSQRISSVETRIEEDKRTNESELGDTANACCGDSRACSSQVLDGVSTICAQSELDGSNPPSASTNAVKESFGNEHVSEEAYKFILRVGTSSDDTKQLEDSTTSHLVSMALGHPGPSDSASRAESCSRLEQFQTDVHERELKRPILQSEIELATLKGPAALYAQLKAELAGEEPIAREEEPEGEEADPDQAMEEEIQEDGEEANPEAYFQEAQGIGTPSQSTVDAILSATTGTFGGVSGEGGSLSRTGSITAAAGQSPLDVILGRSIAPPQGKSRA